MLDQNDLLAIAQLMDQKLEQRFAEQDRKIEQRFAEQDRKMEERFAEQDRKIEERFTEQDRKIEQRLTSQDQKIGSLKTEMIEQMNIIIESRVEKQIQLLAEGHRDILEKLPEVDKVRDLEERVSTLETITKMQRQELNAMKGA
ncbi:hypothetical protein [Clostridium sp. D33t1_170424_F3]|uniref:hypothetical protein n=1 Tax=Clostridium sp. D33t1_170424_F3 TaxID=2787099 RepID=UPI0018A8A531|nr:hypothetical protein [Clostridium sp. D33t1_170424_F3]